MPAARALAAEVEFLLLPTARDRVKGQSCLPPCSFIGNDQHAVRSEGDPFRLTMPLSRKPLSCNDLTARRKLRDSPLTSRYDKVVSRHRMSLDARRLEFLAPDVPGEFNNRYYGTCRFD